MKFCCVIPFYNEDERIINTLDIVSSVAEFSEIICVDDGSIDNAKNIIVRRFPHIQLYIHEINKGKTTAIATALSHTTADAIFLLDADLQHLHAQELRKAIENFSKGMYDMIILRRIKSPWFIKLNRADLLFTGQRILWRNDIETILRLPVYNYEIESAINKFMRKNKKKVGWIPSEMLNTFKVFKKTAAV